MKKLDDGREGMRSRTSWTIAMTLVASFERLVRGVTLLCLYREGVRRRSDGLVSRWSEKKSGARVTEGSRGCRHAGLTDKYNDLMTISYANDTKFYDRCA